MPKSKAPPRPPETFAYVRVSTRDQNEDRQLLALEPYHIPPQNILVEKQSDKDFNRPKYKRLLRLLRSGDLLYIKSIDRLGRNYNEIVAQWRYLTRKKGVDIKVLDMPLLDTTFHKDLLGTFISNLVLQVLSFSAQQERDYLLQRQAEGIAAAKLSGVQFGRRVKTSPPNIEAIYDRWRDGELTRDDAAALCGFGVRTLYARTSEWRRRDGRM